MGARRANKFLTTVAIRFALLALPMAGKSDDNPLKSKRLHCGSQDSLLIYFENNFNNFEGVYNAQFHFGVSAPVAATANQARKTLLHIAMPNEEGPRTHGLGGLVME